MKSYDNSADVAFVSKNDWIVSWLTEIILKSLFRTHNLCQTSKKCHKSVLQPHLTKKENIAPKMRSNL